MSAMHPEFIVDQRDRKKSVILSVSEWRRLIEAAEELEDIRAYDKAMAKKDKAVPFEEAVRQIKSKSRR